MAYPILVKTLFLKIQAGRTDSRFPKTFSSGYFVAFVNYLCNRSPEMEKKLKNYVSILTFVSFRKWLNASPPLKVKEKWHVKMNVHALDL